MLISFIVVAKNEARHIKLCLDGIRNLRTQQSALELIVVDNLSSDETASVARSCGATVYQRGSGTIGSLRNYGAAQSKGDLICFIDADVIVSNEWLAKLLSLIGADERIACVCGVEKWFGSRPTWVEKVWLAQKSNRSREVLPAGWCSTQAMIVRRSHFEEMCGFDEILQTCEDYDLGMRLSQKYQVLRCNSAFHEHLRPSKNVGEFFRREFWRGQDNFKGALRHGVRLRELPSLLLPLFWGLCLVLQLLFCVAFWYLLYARNLYSPELFLAIAAFFAGAVASLALITAKSIRNMRTAAYIPQVLYLNALYLSARFLAFVFKAVRVASG